jgi:hypothetical protein
MFALGKPRTLGAAAAVAAAALAVAGCGSSSTTSSGTGAMIGSSAISRAANISGAAKGEKVAYTLTESLPSVGKLTMTGTGAFNTSPQQGEMSMNISIPGIASLGSQAASLSQLPLTLVIDNKTIYAKLPSALSSKFSTFTGGKSWVSINLAQFAASSKVPGLSNLLSGQGSSPMNPAASLQQLKAASANGITKVGTATVNGVSTTEYKASLDLSKLSSTLPAAQRKVLKQQLAIASKQMGLTQIPFEVYIDSANLIRRLTMDISYSVNGTKVPASLQMDFLAYGAQPAPTVPAASDTDDLTSLLSMYSGKSGSSSGSSSGSGSGILGG